MIPLWVFIAVSAVAAVSLAMWVWAERDNRYLERLLDDVEDELRVALAIDDVTARRQAVVLHAIDGGRS